MYAASSAPASYAPTPSPAHRAQGADAPGDGPAPSLTGGSRRRRPRCPPRAHCPLAPPPPPRPRRRSAGFAGFALVLGVAVVGYGAGLMLDGPLDFSGSRELFGGVIALGAASLATMVIGLTGRRSLMSVALVMILGLGTAVAGVGEQTWGGGQGTRTWIPSLSTTTTRYEHGAGETTIDLRPARSPQLASSGTDPGAERRSLTDAPAPSATRRRLRRRHPRRRRSHGPGPPVPTVPQQIEIEQGAGEMTIIVPDGANAQIRATSTSARSRSAATCPAGSPIATGAKRTGPARR